MNPQPEHLTAGQIVVCSFFAGIAVALIIVSRMLGRHWKDL